MKERPIIFSAPMIRAILSGKKTQTRRLVRPQPSPCNYLQPMWGTSPDGYEFGDKFLWRETGPDYPDDSSDDRRCPYGEPGDRLWARETFTHVTGNGIRVHWRADGEPIDRDGRVLPTDPGRRRWTPAIHMSRRDSRLTLDLTEVRVQRLQDISERDILAEGVDVPLAAKVTGTPWGDILDLFTAWRLLWDHINGTRRRREYLGSDDPEYSHDKPYRTVIDTSARWEADPWVWVLTFKPVGAP